MLSCTNNIEHVKLPDIRLLALILLQAALDISSQRSFWTPYRSNMKGAKQHKDRKLRALRRTIEGRFAGLNTITSCRE